ncbi:hypothetical protein TSOC_003723 [Tetrabaena socialis]|uniref:Uncharacterized protein n=1 Tax=Tetrabaena socialis TaxID=47790 RepID=A0A2J8AAT3_9CHLO|nr:hypothetical protein TSOC_003723 [Tetrabaena socialis]|eukprot:PNH09639.1 hypothetical protein TSOC_003723 [Tetrabaena socialis]
MSEVDLPKAAVPEEAVADGGEDDPATDDEEEGEALDEELDEEAVALMAELEESQLEVQRMIAAQREQATELGGMKDHLASELQQLQDDAWKLQVFAELEMLKRQLAAINNLDGDLDAMEAQLDKEGEGAVGEGLERDLAAARAGTADLLAKLGVPSSRPLLAPRTAGAEEGSTSKAAAGEGGSAGADAEEGEECEEDMEAMQDELDAELATMYAQLQAIKEESAMVAARKAQLELELMQLIREGADELTSQLQDLDVEDGAAEGEAAVVVAEEDAVPA